MGAIKRSVKSERARKRKGLLQNKPGKIRGTSETNFRTKNNGQREIVKIKKGVNQKG